MKRVFVSHPLSDDPIVRKEENRALLERLIQKHPDVLFISPLLLFDCYETDEDIRDEIMEMCQDLIKLVDEVWSFGNTSGCMEEREYAEAEGIPLTIMVHSRLTDEERFQNELY